ncbi:MAG: SsrA-binding protein SmpB [Candidatus Marinimicrobia bacterium]|nr:SsrA-binding protein SmpB [Candidatus Neomarinimicrobiota bacterium]MBL7022622.1 SsrA-binding protein SmpB [Candidatus Neomarinimicrobiota bacterium]MBL7109635.1 SsrA-binding protein SmpB [Candidatus Neomarinimicrobiota bacterium]
MEIMNIATNRKARHEYHIQEKYEAGIVLQGSEVKALREGKANIKESYVRFIKGELFVVGMHIAEYSNAGYVSHTPVHDRKLLLHKRELKKLARIVDEKGKTLIPLSIYFKNGLAKLEFAIAQGKKMWDKRQTIADRDAKRNTDRIMKGFNK